MENITLKQVIDNLNKEYANLCNQAKVISEKINTLNEAVKILKETKNNYFEIVDEPGDSGKIDHPLYALLPKVDINKVIGV